MKYISLVNLIMDREIVKELIQDEMNAENLRKELDLLLNDSEKRKQLSRDYAALHALLGAGGDASAKAAAAILRFIKE